MRGCEKADFARFDENFKEPPPTTAFARQETAASVRWIIQKKLGTVILHAFANEKQRNMPVSGRAGRVLTTWHFLKNLLSSPNVLAGV